MLGLTANRVCFVDKYSVAQAGLELVVLSLILLS